MAEVSVGEQPHPLGPRAKRTRRHGSGTDEPLRDDPRHSCHILVSCLASYPHHRLAEKAIITSQAGRAASSHHTFHPSQITTVRRGHPLSSILATRLRTDAARNRGQSPTRTDARSLLRRTLRPRGGILVVFRWFLDAWKPSVGRPCVRSWSFVSVPTPGFS